MINKKIEHFLEKTDMNYLFCLLAKLEAQRISQLPTYVKHRLPDKIAVVSMNHVADNEVPDYFAEIEEANIAMAAVNSPFKDDDNDLGEETFDDTKDHIEELVHENLDSYPDDDDEEEIDLGDHEVEDDED